MPRDLLLHSWPCDDPRVCSDREWGCGYPGDKNTVRWLQENLHPVFGWPDLVRFSIGCLTSALGMALVSLRLTVYGALAAPLIGVLASTIGTHVGRLGRHRAREDAK